MSLGLGAAGGRDRGGERHRSALALSGDRALIHSWRVTENAAGFQRADGTAWRFSRFSLRHTAPSRCAQRYFDPVHALCHHESSLGPFILELLE